MARFLFELRVPCSAEMRRDLRRYAEENECSIAEAARRMIRGQLQYLRWDGKVRRRGSDGAMEALARTILEKNPKYSLDHLTYEIIRHSGRKVDQVQAREAAERVMRKKEGEGASAPS